MTKGNEVKVPKRILSSLLSSISAGVVPRQGAPYIAIGREAETAALLSDLEITAEGGSSTRFIIGRYGSGKSFLMQLVRGYALEKGFLTCDADLSPERRLHGSQGSGVATYRELIKNLASRSSPEGGALPKIIAAFLASEGAKLVSEGVDPASPDYSAMMRSRVFSVIRELEDSVGGFDFAAVMSLYYTAGCEDDEIKKSAAMRWLRGEYSTKTEARAALGIPVSTVINDDNWYDYIKLMAVFARKLGYKGLVVFLDECVNLYKIPNRVSRENNYEKLLAMFNDTLGGRAPGLSLIFGGTPKFLEDTRRGLFSYEALRSRLSDGAFSGGGYTDLIGPVIRLRTLSDDELLALVTRLTILHGQYYPEARAVSPEEMVAFLTLEGKRAGADIMMTPREVIRDYLNLLNILMQNPSVSFGEIMGTLPGGEEKKPSDTPAAEVAAPPTQPRTINIADIDF